MADRSKTRMTEERRRVEEALKASEVRYRRLFEAAKDGILILDAATGTITDSNPFLERMLGYHHTELLGRKLWEIGPFRDIAASRDSFRRLQDNEYIRYDDLPLETKTGEHRQVEFISNIYLENATKVIQCNIRDITARKQDQANLHEANEKLCTLVKTLQRRDGEMKLINRMNDLLQTCETPQEAYRAIGLIAAELFVGQSGGLAVFLESGRYLETVSRWGGEDLLENTFAVEDCWALRRGLPHDVPDPRTNLLCSHFVRTPDHGYRCLPLTVKGGTIGILYLGAVETAAEEDRDSQRQLAITVGEAIKLTMANLQLRKRLHEQATRDPLTHLFNRRYLEDTLPRELHHAIRRGTPLCIAMLDLDHFKNFNDTYGHEAGDLVLRETSRVLCENLRLSDIACRYGGEEFLLVLPDSTPEDTNQRLEQIRVAFAKMEIRNNGQVLATPTFSAGIAAAKIHGSSPDDLLRAADDALYAAKQAGRDRILAYRARA